MKTIDDVVILCGGRGTRLQEHTQAIPKPLVEIGGVPIVGHVIQIYAAHGLRRFMLCTGHKGELIEEFVDSRNRSPVALEGQRATWTAA
jgi:glucose-1-phosphate cytidylyltransferase